MKKLIYISIATFGLAFVSCQKQEFSPVSSEMQVPEWQDDTSEKDFSDLSSFMSEGSNAKGGSSEEEGGNDTPPVGNDNNGITDPNEDPDGSGKKGKGNK